MRTVNSISEDEMIAVFLRCELGSKRFGACLLHALEQGAVDLSIIKSPDLFDEIENRQRRDLLGETRGFQRDTSLFRMFPEEVRWSRVIVTEQELTQVLYTNYDYWVELSGGSRSPADAAKRIRRGVEIFNQPNYAFWSAARVLEEAKQFEDMIFVTHDGKRLVVLEGHVRLTSFVLAQDRMPEELEAIVGQSAKMSDWPLY